MDSNPRPPESPADDQLLEDLAALSGLLNPERIWQQEQQLDDLNEAQAREGETSAHPKPSTSAAD